ncbi:MAG: isoleucine--tRNA ligase [Firmicutes bacterium]|nr:isoleucine--tRNA ligase [Bacillota bacterium]
MYKNLSTKPVGENEFERATKWKEDDLLKKCYDAREGCESFVWVEGPPTANGRPGIHHAMARTLKDSVIKYKIMKGYQSWPRAGWDTHGLPVELEVEKELGFKNKFEIEEYGIEKFNKKCKESVFKYVSDWEDLSLRLGMTIDLDDSYITFDNNYIETGWHVLKSTFDRGLLFEGYKVVPWCPRCGTGLASHEVALGYQEDDVLTLTCKFRKKGTENEYYLAWTTTAWTLYSNVAIMVHPDLTYIWAKMLSGVHEGCVFCVAEGAADRVLGAGNYEIVRKETGKELENQEYETIFPEANVPEGNRFKVICGDFVVDTDGTGLVHSAPAFGEDDYVTGQKYDIVFFQPVDLEGKFTEGPWEGHFIMEDGLAVEIMKYLGDEKVYDKETIAHNYPHCWRCQTPLVYYANRSWYIGMSQLKDELVANNNTVNWWPPYVGDKRFGNWLADVKDWAISRNRYWGTPIPIWRCECSHLECIGSRKELVEKAIEDIDESIELHRPYVDDVHLKCPECGKTMSRIPEVMDCWFDSGCAPFAQWHWPFENTDDFDTDRFPADFICEGIDQTRGWFYSLMAVSTLMKNKSPYRNVLVNDLILDKNGKKMSKSRGNTVNPFELFEKYGADAAKWYLVSVSPAWTPTKFDEDGLKDTVSKFFGTLKNVYNFFVLYSNQDDVDCASLDVPYENRPELDRWILSKYNRLVETVTYEMDHYDHMKTVRAIQDFVTEDLSNWYIRRARRRFWGSEMTDDKKAVYKTTYEVLVGISKLMAPIACFLADEMYTNLTGEYSVHLADFPVADKDMIDVAAEDRMDTLRTIVSLGRGAREKEKLKVRQPLSAMLLDRSLEETVGDLAPLMMDELNVKEVQFVDDIKSYMSYELKPNFKAAGPALGSKVKAFGKALSEVDPESFVAELEDGCFLDLDGDKVTINKDLVDVKIIGKEGYAVGVEGGIQVAIATALDQELIDEGLAREVISKVQQMRKQKNFEMMDNIDLTLDADDEVKAAVEKFKEYIMTETLAKELSFEAVDDTYKINGHKTGISIEKA